MMEYAGGTKNPNSAIVWTGWWDGLNKLGQDPLLYRSDIPQSTENILTKQANDIGAGYMAAMEKIHEIACLEFGVTVNGVLSHPVLSSGYKHVEMLLLASFSNLFWTA